MADDIYYVEKIVGRRVLKGKPYYNIKWEGIYIKKEASTNLTLILIKTKIFL